MNLNLDWRRFIRWCVYNVLFAALPLFSVWFFRLLSNKETIEKISDYPELLFFSMMVCATAKSDIGGRKNQDKWNAFFLILDSMLILGAISSAIMYGALRFVNVANPLAEIQPLSSNLILLVIFLLLLVGIASEILITFTDDTKENSGQVKNNE